MTVPLQLVTTTLCLGVPEALPSADILFTKSTPDETLPNTTYFPFNQGVYAVVIKNCDPFVSFPAFAIDMQ